MVLSGLRFIPCSSEAANVTKCQSTDQLSLSLSSQDILETKLGQLKTNLRVDDCATCAAVGCRVCLSVACVWSRAVWSHAQAGAPREAGRRRESRGVRPQLPHRQGEVGASHHLCSRARWRGERGHGQRRGLEPPRTHMHPQPLLQTRGGERIDLVLFWSVSKRGFSRCTWVGFA